MATNDVVFEALGDMASAAFNDGAGNLSDLLIQISGGGSVNAAAGMNIFLAPIPVGGGVVSEGNNWQFADNGTVKEAILADNGTTKDGRLAEV